MSRLIAIFFGAGLLKPAPGTWGSLVAIILGVLIDRYLGFPVLVAGDRLARRLRGFGRCDASLPAAPVTIRQSS